MIRLAAVLFILVASVLGGAAVTAVLALRLLQPAQIAAAFAVGIIVAMPLALFLARRIYSAIDPLG